LPIALESAPLGHNLAGSGTFSGTFLLGAWEAAAMEAVGRVSPRGGER
jgi:hypothetical protein